MRKKLTYNRLVLTILLALFNATYVVAQDERVITQDEQGVYAVGFHPGSQYTWEVVTQFSPVIDANPNDYRFVSGPNLHEVGMSGIRPDVIIAADRNRRFGMYQRQSVVGFGFAQQPFHRVCNGSRQFVFSTFG
jgi:hypothetical protein